MTDEAFCNCLILVCQRASGIVVLTLVLYCQRCERGTRCCSADPSEHTSGVFTKPGMSLFPFNSGALVVCLLPVWLGSRLMDSHGEQDQPVTVEYLHKPRPRLPFLPQDATTPGWSHWFSSWVAAWGARRRSAPSVASTRRRVPASRASWNSRSPPRRFTPARRNTARTTTIPCLWRCSGARVS